MDETKRKYEICDERKGRSERRSEATSFRNVERGRRDPVRARSQLLTFLGEDGRNVRDICEEGCPNRNANIRDRQVPLPDLASVRGRNASSIHLCLVGVGRHVIDALLAPQEAAKEASSLAAPNLDLSVFLSTGENQVLDGC